jgi:hypothetical protein
MSCEYRGDNPKKLASKAGALEIEAGTNSSHQKK